MLKLLRLQIAAFFSLGIVGVLLLQSILFIAIEYRSDIRRMDGEMAEDAQRIVYTMTELATADLDTDILSAIDQNNIRVYEANGALQFIGLIFHGEDTTFSPDAFVMEYGNEHYRVLTFPIFLEGDTIGFLQIGEKFRRLSDRISQNALPLLFLSLTLSAIMMILGLLFQTRIMTPVHQVINSMEQFAQNAGHELRTPLANMQSSLDVALRSGDYKEGLEEVQADLQTMQSLVDRLLELESMDESVLDSQPLNLSLLADSIVQKFEPALEERGLRIEKNIQPDVIRIADAELIRTALTGLIQNASKFTPEGGIISVTVRHGLIEIQDTGIGMAPEIAERIFERFFKADTSRNNDGFGLGLALIKRIMDLHRWQITVSSRPGKGTTFRILFRRK